jgi:hypothetical protein
MERKGPIWGLNAEDRGSLASSADLLGLPVYRADIDGLRAVGVTASKLNNPQMRPESGKRALSPATCRSRRLSPRFCQPRLAASCSWAVELEDEQEMPSGESVFGEPAGLAAPVPRLEDVPRAALLTVRLSTTTRPGAFRGTACCGSDPTGHAKSRVGSHFPHREPQ